MIFIDLVGIQYESMNLDTNFNMGKNAKFIIKYDSFVIYFPLLKHYYAIYYEQS